MEGEEGEEEEEGEEGGREVFSVSRATPSDPHCRGCHARHLFQWNSDTNSLAGYSGITWSSSTLHNLSAHPNQHWKSSLEIRQPLLLSITKGSHLSTVMGLLFSFQQTQLLEQIVLERPHANVEQTSDAPRSLRVIELPHIVSHTCQKLHDARFVSNLVVESHRTREPRFSRGATQWTFTLPKLS